MHGVVHQKRLDIDAALGEDQGVAGVVFLFRLVVVFAVIHGVSLHRIVIEFVHRFQRLLRIFQFFDIGVFLFFERRFELFARVLEIAVQPKFVFERRVDALFRFFGKFQGLFFSLFLLVFLVFGHKKSPFIYIDSIIVIFMTIVKSLTIYYNKSDDKLSSVLADVEGKERIYLHSDQ